MIEFVDRQAGVAAFRRGRSLCLRLEGRLDAAMARAVEARVAGERDAVRLRLECSSLRALDLPAARRLAAAVLAWTQRSADGWVDVLNLDLALQRQLSSQPMRILLEPAEILFLDPDREVAEPVASRH